MILLIKLLLAHLVGDFLLQPNRWVEDKEEKKLRSPWLYLHIALHGALPWLLVQQVGFWKYALGIALTHGAIDILKLYVQTNRTKRRWFVIDQLLHLLVIGLVWYRCATPASLSLASWMTERNLLVLTAVVFLTVPASVMIRMLIARWALETEEGDGESLQQAGQYIGILERLFVLTFLLAGHWEPIGFLIAAKSVFRFGNLKESKDRKLTEYILIGTLLSFGIAVLVGMFTQYLIS